jgi:hypothetical protein
VTGREPFDMADDAGIPQIRFRHLVRRGAPSLLEGSLVPYVVLAAALRIAGFRTAVVVTLACTLGIATFRWLSGRRVPGILVLSILALAARTVFAVVTGDAVVYFLQPVLATLLVAGAFAGSAILGRPLAWRLANDFVAIPERALADAHLGDFFRRLSFAWACVHLTKATITVWLLWSVSLADFVVLKGVLSIGLMGSAILGSVLWFQRVVSRAGRLATAPVPA